MKTHFVFQNIPLVDLIQENSITKVLALIMGGGLCFFISYIYNKLSESTK